MKNSPTIDTTVPTRVTGFAVYDTVKVLEFSGENGNKRNGEWSTTGSIYITIKGQKITVKLTEDEAKALGGKAVHVNFKAKDQGETCQTISKKMVRHGFTTPLNTTLTMTRDRTKF